MDPEIRQLGKDDLAALLELYQQLHPKDSPLPPGNMIEALWNHILENPLLHYFGAFRDGRMLSTCTITIVPNLTRSCRPYGLIENVVTDASHRREGFGRRVLEAALELAWDENCYKVMLMTSRMDEETALFYESAGFERNKKEAFIAKPHS